MKENKLIAEFMDYDNVDEMFPFDGDLHYHSSWDWLMPVVEECRLESRCKYDTDANWDKIHWALEEVNKEETYKAVVEFIKQHNNEV